jgi:predicted alpha/beta-fold hydrolase
LSTAGGYRAPRWLRGGHAQTITAARLAQRPRVAYRRERWHAPDGDFIEVDFALPEPPAEAAPIVVLFHGLEGDSGSHYALATMRLFADRGWRAVVAHFRGCGGEPNALSRAYHSGDSDEADWILRRFATRWPRALLHAVGISLGGNMLAKWLGERQEEAGILAAAASISSPLDLAAGGAALSRGFNLVYTKMFLATLKPKALQKIERFGPVADAEQVRQARDLYDYDNAYTAPVHGFRNTDDYWARASGKPWLAAVTVPHLVLNALNDPFVPVASLARAQDVSSQVRLEQPTDGGHAGFVQGALPGRLDYLPQRLYDWFTRGQ